MGELPGLTGGRLSWDISEIMAAIDAAQRDLPRGSAVEEKIDGHWCAIQVGHDGVVVSATSRAGLPLRVAIPWLGRRIRLFGWTLIGEIVAGTEWSACERQHQGAVPDFRIFDAYCAKWGRVSRSRLERVIPSLGDRRLSLVARAKWGECWSDFAKRVLAAGGEGVVVKHADGSQRWKAKPILDVDMVVKRVFSEPDRDGRLRVKVGIGYADTDEVQVVLLPSVATPDDIHRDDVVRVVGACKLCSGAIRHARIVEVRPIEDKPVEECRHGETIPESSANLDD